MVGVNRIHNSIMNDIHTLAAESDNKLGIGLHRIVNSMEYEVYVGAAEGEGQRTNVTTTQSLCFAGNDFQDVAWQ